MKHLDYLKLLTNPLAGGSGGGGSSPTGTVDIVANGTANVAAYAEAKVAVPGGLSGGIAYPDIPSSAIVIESDDFTAHDFGDRLLTAEIGRSTNSSKIKLDVFSTISVGDYVLMHETSNGQDYIVGGTVRSVNQYTTYGRVNIMLTMRALSTEFLTISDSGYADVRGKNLVNFSGGGGGGITPSGSIDINANGTYDVTAKASAVVAVPQGMTPEDKAKWEAFCANGCVDGEVPDCIEYLPFGVKYQNQNIKSVSAPQVKQIPMAAFYGDTHLQSVSFPEATMIGVFAFHNCSALTTINAPKVAEISDDDYSGVPAYGSTTTFDGLSSLTAINFPLLTNIVLGLSQRNALFSGVNSLASVNLSGLVSSDSTLIDGNNQAPLTEANLDLSSLERVTGGRYVLMQCPNITSLSLPNLTEGGFYKLTGLTSLNVPKITDLNLNGCNNLTLANIVYDKTLVTKLTILPTTVAALTDTEFPAVTELDTVCSNNTNLTNVSLSNVTKVGASAFLNCTALQSALLPAATTLGNNTFKGCSHLATVDVSNATSIGGSGFENCVALTKLNLPKLKTINSRLVAGCSALTELVIGGETLTFVSVTSSTNSAFYGCSAMAKLVLSGVTSVPTLPSTYALQGLPTTCDIYVPDDLVNSFKSATTWSSRSSHIKPLSDYIPS